jgi:hypothetical protein
MFRDPIYWPTLKSDLLACSAGLHLSIQIPQLTDRRFNERLQPSHKARMQTTAKEMKYNHIYQFFNPYSPVENEETHLKAAGIDPQSAHIINTINRHNRSLSALGIIPSQLRTFARNSIPDYDQALLELSKTLFWKGYAIWIRRKTLVADYWKNIAPDDWKHKRQKKLTEKKRKKNNIKAIYKCRNPFHFLKKHNDLTHQRPTPCSCSYSQCSF